MDAEQRKYIREYGYSSFDTLGPMYFIRPFKETNSTLARLRVLSKELKWLGNQREARKIFCLLCVNLTGTILLLIWCRLTSSLALLAYTYLSWFNFLSMVTCLLCVWVEAQVASYSYTFGLIRCEVLAVFSSVTLTLLGALFVLKESIERLIQPEAVQLDGVCSVAVLGLLLNLIMTAFAHNPALNHILRFSSSSLLQEHFTDMCQSICLQVPGLRRLLLPRINPLVLVSITGFVFIVADYIVVELYNYPRGDTVAAVLISLFTVTTMYPLCICSAHFLLQTIPAHFSAHLDKCLREALTIDGVLEFHNEKFWLLGVGFGAKNKSAVALRHMAGYVIIGNLHVRVRRDASEQVVLNQVQNRLKPLVPLLTVQVYKDDWTRSSVTLHLLKDPGLSLMKPPLNISGNERISSSIDLSGFSQARQNGTNILPSSASFTIQPERSVCAHSDHSAMQSIESSQSSVVIPNSYASLNVRKNYSKVPYQERLLSGEKETDLYANDYKSSNSRVNGEFEHFLSSSEQTSEFCSHHNNYVMNNTIPSKYSCNGYVR